MASRAQLKVLVGEARDNNEAGVGFGGGDDALAAAAARGDLWPQQQSQTPAPSPPQAAGGGLAAAAAIRVLELALPLPLPHPGPSASSSPEPEFWAPPSSAVLPVANGMGGAPAFESHGQQPPAGARLLGCTVDRLGRRRVAVALEAQREGIAPAIQSSVAFAHGVAVDHAVAVQLRPRAQIGGAVQLLVFLGTGRLVRFAAVE